MSFNNTSFIIAYYYYSLLGVLYKHYSKFIYFIYYIMSLLVISKVQCMLGRNENCILLNIKKEFSLVYIGLWNCSILFSYILEFFKFIYQKKNTKS